MGGYFKHADNARNNDGVQMIMKELSYKGYYFWFALLEIYNDQFKTTGAEKCSFHKSYLYKELKCTERTLSRCLELCSKFLGLSYEIKGTMVDIRIPKILTDKPKIKTEKKTVNLTMVESFVETWNDTLGKQLGMVKTLNTTRKNKVSKTIKTYPDKEQWISCFRKTYSSDFLMGRKTHWRASFDFICKEENFTKTIEGIYDNNKNKKEEDKNKLFSEIKKKKTDDAFLAVIERRGLNE
jgi:hypothetical protein